MLVQLGIGIPLLLVTCFFFIWGLVASVGFFVLGQDSTVLDKVLALLLLYAGLLGPPFALMFMLGMF